MPHHTPLIAILVAISVFRTTGCMDYLVGAIANGVAALGLDFSRSIRSPPAAPAVPCVGARFSVFTRLA